MIACENAANCAELAQFQRELVGSMAKVTAALIVVFLIAYNVYQWRYAGDAA